jgi:hypothetical protein
LSSTRRETNKRDAASFVFSAPPFARPGCKNVQVDETKSTLLSVTCQNRKA